MQGSNSQMIVVGNVKEQVWLLARRIIININEIINISKSINKINNFINGAPPCNQTSIQSQMKVVHLKCQYLNTILHSKSEQ